MPKAPRRGPLRRCRELYWYLRNARYCKFFCKNIKKFIRISEYLRDPSEIPAKGQTKTPSQAYTEGRLQSIITKRVIVLFISLLHTVEPGTRRASNRLSVFGVQIYSESLWVPLRGAYRGCWGPLGVCWVPLSSIWGGFSTPVTLYITLGASPRILRTYR